MPPQVAEIRIDLDFVNTVVPHVRLVNKDTAAILFPRDAIALSGWSVIVPKTSD